METIKVCNEAPPALYGLNFSLKEFWLPFYNGYLYKNGNPPSIAEYNLYKCLPLALQVFRDYFSKLYGSEIKWTVTSAYRPWDDLSLPEAHRVIPPAVDSKSSDLTLWNDEICSKIRNECKRWEQSELITNVLATGCNVIIIEFGCLHLHWRNKSSNHFPDNVKYPFGIYIGEWGMKNEKQFNIGYSYNK